MASWKDLVDNTLEKVFNKKPDNADKTAERRRKGVLEGIDKSIAALKKGDEKGPRGWYVTKGDVVRASLRTGTRTVKLDGKEAVFVPKERAADFYVALRKEVEAKGFDEAINAAWVADAPTGKRGGRGPRGPMDPEKLYQRNVQRYGKERADQLRKAG